MGGEGAGGVLGSVPSGVPTVFPPAPHPIPLPTSPPFSEGMGGFSLFDLPGLEQKTLRHLSPSRLLLPTFPPPPSQGRNGMGGEVHLPRWDWGKLYSPSLPSPPLPLPASSLAPPRAPHPPPTRPLSGGPARGGEPTCPLLQHRLQRPQGSVQWPRRPSRASRWDILREVAAQCGPEQGETSSLEGGGMGVGGKAHWPGNPFGIRALRR